MRDRKGLTLVELLGALLVSSFLVAATYRIFLFQHRTYTTQEQVLDMQQNVRVAMSQMMKEIRIAGYGGKNANTGGENDIIKTFGNINGFASIINPINDSPRADNVGDSDEITVVAAFEEFGKLDQDANAGSMQIRVRYDHPNDPAKKFNNNIRKYLCVCGGDNYTVVNAVNFGNTGALTISPALRQGYRARDSEGKLIQPWKSLFLVKAIRYGLRVRPEDKVPVLFRDPYPNTGSTHRDTVAEYIEDLQFSYVLIGGLPDGVDAPVADPRRIQAVRLRITGRTQMKDLQLGGDGYRRRQFTSSIQLRNMGS